MKTKYMAAGAVVAILTASGAARADDLTSLKKQAITLKKQNAALEKRLNKLEKQQAAQAAKPVAQQPTPESFIGMVTKGPLEVINDEGPLTWNGITIFGTVDSGLGYASHGAPNSGQLYVGDTLISKFYNHANFGIDPNGLSQTTLGIKGEEQLLPGVSGVFYASTGINPQSGQLANAPGSMVANNGVPLANSSMGLDGTRGGQAFNDQLYAGFATKEFGQLTFGRQKTLSNDLISNYDPAGGSYDYSVLGFSGTPVAGLGFTDDGRIDDALKYRVEYGPAHFGALYKFADGTAGAGATCGTGSSCKLANDAYQFNLGGSISGFDIDAMFSHFNQAVTYGTLGTGTTTVNGVVENNLGNPGLAGIAADTTGLAIMAKYTWGQFKFYAGYANDTYNNPHDPIGVGANIGQGDYMVIAPNNTAFPNTKILQTEWWGVKYAYDPRTDLTLAYYHEGQNTFGTPASNKTCANVVQSTRAGTCSGDLNAVSAYVDYHFSKRFDIYGGMMYSVATGGMSNGYLYYNNFAPSAGVRYTF